MPRLEDLKRNLLDMTPDELRERIRQIRSDRILRKVQPKTKVAKAKKESKIKVAIAALSPEELAKLLSDMEEE